MNFFRHLKTVVSHRHKVISNGFHLGIFWHCLTHDLSKFSPTEFFTSVKYFQGYRSPVYEERENNSGYSKIAVHHTKRNRHHWEYYTDFYKGEVIAKNMPYVYALEYVADSIAASMVYNHKHYQKELVLPFVEERIDRYFLTDFTKAFLLWCFNQYHQNGFKGLKKSKTKKKYLELEKQYEIVKRFPYRRQVDEK